MDCADRVREILSSKGLTLYRISQQSAETFGRSSPYYIPHHLYSDLAIPLRRPSIHQFIALSRLSNYRLSDWLLVFGFDLNQIPRIQLSLPRRHTVLLDSSVYDENAGTSWFEEKFPLGTIAGIAPLGSLLRSGPRGWAGARTNVHSQEFLYAKLGDEDQLGFPDLMPGGIVRVDARRAAERPDRGAGPSRQIFLVEHDSVLRCGRLQRSGKDRIVLCSLKFPFSRIELNSDPAFRIYGAVDGEIRPLAHASVSCRLLSFANRRHLDRQTSTGVSGLGGLVRSSRLRAGFSFREASALSWRIARALHDDMYFIAVGTLSEYETLVVLPRSVHKILSICILYGIGFWELLSASGLALGPTEGDPIADALVSGRVPGMDRSSDQTAAERGVDEPGLLATVMAEWSEIPLFAKDALAFVAGLKDLSLSDVFWVGGDRNPIHPYLVHTLEIRD
ncbi:MAG: hypothetical protein JWO71_2823 [Candidatus Acidoferrum typicum]|nr:hypothetical protein [Candidatus Acidoferrum typicum]